MAQINRRTFIRVGALTALAACAPGAEDTTTTGAGAAATTTAAGASTTAAAAGTDVTRVIFAVAPPEAESNRTRELRSPAEFQIKPMYENLIGADPQTGAWIPMLAESWEVEGDGQSIRFFLKEGVQFHNDLGEFTAEDVLYTWQDLIDPPDAIVSEADLAREYIVDIEVAGPHEVVFHLTAVNWDFMELLGQGAGAFGIKSKADFDARGGVLPGLDEAPLAGTGPYQYVSRAPAENVVFEKVPYDHWRINPEFEELEFRIITEGSARLAALLANEVHIADVPAELLERAVEGGMSIIKSATPGRRVAINYLGAYLADPANTDAFLYPDSPMTDIRFRRALSKSIDTDTLNEAFFGGQGEPIYSWFWIPELPGWNPEWEARFQEEYGYDPDVSLALLEELRAEGTFGTDFTVEMLATEGRGGPETADVIEAVAGMFTDVGVNAPISTIDITEHRDKQRSLGFSCAVEMDDSSSENITGARPKIYALHTSRGSAVESPAIIPLWETVRDTLDPEEQTAAWRILGDAVYDLHPHKPLVRLAQSLAVNPAVVAGYTFPGAMLSVPYSHYEYIEKA